MKNPVIRGEVQVALSHVKKSPSALLLIGLISTGSTAAVIFSAWEIFHKPDLLWNRFSDRPAFEKIQDGENRKLISFGLENKSERVPVQEQLRKELGPYKYSR